MHFRLRGNNVQIVKTLPEEGTGRAKSQPIGSVSLATGEINEKAAAALTPEETQEVKAWVARHQAIQAQKREIEYRTLAETLTRMAGWVRDADRAVLEEHAEEVIQALRVLRRAIDRRRGVAGREAAQDG
jgi:hypothetical protein